jgi:hypothetical protein
MSVALQGIGTPAVYPTPTLPLTFNPQLLGTAGVSALYGPYVPQQLLQPYLPQPLQQLQAAIHQLLQTQFVQQQQLQQLVHIVPQQLQQIQQLIQFVAQQTSQNSPWQQTQPFLPNVGYPMTSFGHPSGWLGSSPVTQPQIFAGQGGFGGQSGYVM